MSDFEEGSGSQADILAAVQAAARDANIDREFSQDDLNVVLAGGRTELYQQIKDLASRDNAYDALGLHVPLQAALLQADRFLDSVEFQENLNGPNEYTLPDGTKELGNFDRGGLTEGKKTWANGTEDLGHFENGVLTQGERRYTNHTFEKGIFVNNQLWEGVRHVQTSRNSAEILQIHEGKIFVPTEQPAAANSLAPASEASNPEPQPVRNSRSAEISQIRAEAREHPEKVTTGDLKDGLTFTAEKGSDAERRVRIEDIVKGEDRKDVLTSTRYAGKEFKYDAARDSFYESAGDGQFGDQRLVILNGDVIKKKEAAAEPAKVESPKPAEPVAAAPAEESAKAPEPAKAEPEPVAEPVAAPEQIAEPTVESTPFDRLPMKTREFTRSLFGLNKSLLEATDRTDDLQSFSDKLQKALSDKYGVKGADFDLIEAPTPWPKKTRDGFEANAKLDFAILDSKGVQVQRVSFEAKGDGVLKKAAQDAALKAVFAQIWDANNKGSATRYFNGAKVS